MSAKKYTNLTKPITVTIDGNLAAAVRFYALVQRQTNEEYIRTAVESAARGDFEGDDEERFFCAEENEV